MSRRMRAGAARMGWIGGNAAAIACAVAVGCGGTDVVAPVAYDRIPTEPAEPQLWMGPLPLARDVDPAPATGLLRAEGVTVDARLLLITADGSSASFAAIKSAVDYLGTPYDVFNATSGPDLTADALADGDHGRYYGIVLDSGDLASGSTSALSAAEWMTLTSYEARFGVRRAVMYARPAASYGLTLGRGFDAGAAPITAQCTDAGKGVFVGMNCDGPVVIDSGYAYASQPADGATQPLLVDAAGAVYAATRSYDDGREALMLTFAQSPTAFHSLALVYGVVSWVTHGLFIGERHTYASIQIDDFYLPSAIYTGGTYRITGDDLKSLARWQEGRQAAPLTAGLRAAFAFNAAGAASSGDSLSDEALELASSFNWINHTWAHHVMTAMSYADATDAIGKNNQFSESVGLMPYDVANLVTPEVSGLDNPDAMRAAFDAGVRQLVSDSSVTGQGNPSPNAGYWIASTPGLLAIPRRPTGISFNVSQPAEWIAKYRDAHGGVTYSYDQIVAAVSDSLVRYLLRGENDPWMFHQANVRDNGGGKSLLSDTLDAALDKYAARATFPVVSPTMDELGQRVRDRMALNASGVSATIQPDATITVTATSAATVPVTGLCTPSAESYGDQKISYLTLEAGQSVTLSVAGCDGGAGPGGKDPATGHVTTNGSVTPKPAASGGSGCAAAGTRPEPGTAALIVGLGLAMALGAARRRRRDG